jgi:F-type H+-transporting ATPase subunit a
MMHQALTTYAAEQSLHISLKAEDVFHIGSVGINNSLIAGILGSLLIIWGFRAAAKRTQLHPKSKLALAVETLCDGILSAIEQVTHDRAKAIRFFPLLTTLFIFILLNNWFGLLPGVGPITVQTPEGAIPLLRGSNADLNATLALAIISVGMTQIYALRELGVGSHLKKYFSKNPVLSFVGVLEIISEFSKMISFSFRLFGNIFAGEVLLIVIAALVPIIGPLPFFGLELFVGLVQALVFTMLSLVFLEIATSSHGEHEPETAQSPINP